MSHEGRMRRGEFYSTRTNLPDNLKADVEYYKEKTKPVEPKPEVAKKVKKEKKKNDDR